MLTFWKDFGIIYTNIVFFEHIWLDQIPQPLRICAAVSENLFIQGRAVSPLSAKVGPV